MDKKKILVAEWIQSEINTDRDILKLSFGGILLIGSLTQFISFPTAIPCYMLYLLRTTYLLGIFLLSATIFLSIHKLKLNSKYIIIIGTDKKDKDNLKDKIPFYEKLITILFQLGIVFIIILGILLFFIK